MTVQNPRAYPNGSILVPPTLPESRIDTRRLGVSDISVAMRIFLDRPDLDSVVFLLLSHDDKDSLVVDRQVLHVEEFKRMFEPLGNDPDVPTKSVLVVLDSNFSTEFAEQVMTGDSIPENMWIISTSRGVSMRTLVVIGNEASLVNKAPDGTGIDYGIYGSMPTRGLMDIVAYSTKDPTLQDLPGELHARFRNGPSPGFEASCVTGAHQTFYPHLRYFFAGEVTGARAIALQLYLRKIPDGGFFDDYDKAAAAPGEVFPGRRYYRFVRIEAVPGSWAVKEYGLTEIRTDSTDEIARQLASERSGVSLASDGKIHVSILDLISETLEGLERQREMDKDEEKRRTSQVHDILKEINGLEGNDPFFIAHFVDCWGQMSVEGWRTTIQKAHDRLVEKSRAAARSS
jgi:hypothetical protein